MSFWTSDDKIPVKQTKVSVPAENGLDYLSKQTVHFHIPPNVNFIQPKETYLRFDVKIKDDRLGHQGKFMLDKMGGSCVIRDIRVFSGGAGGVLLEEIQNYNTLTALRYSYEQNDSLRNKRQLTEGGNQHNPKSRGTLSGNESETNNLTENAYFNCFPDDANAGDTLSTAHESKKVKCLLPIHTGIFQNDKVFPVMLTDGLRVEILLEDAPRCIVPLSQVSDNQQLNEKVIFHSLSGDDDFTTPWDAPGGAVDTIYVKRDNQQGSSETFPFAVGEAFDLVDMTNDQSRGEAGTTNGNAVILGVDGDMIINSIKHFPYNNGAAGTDEGGEFGITKITLETAVTRTAATYNNRIVGGATEAKSCWVMVSRSLDKSTDAQVRTLDYELSDVELIVQQVEMPQGYTQKLMGMMKQGGALNYDFLSYRNYKYSALANDRQVNMRLPLVESRAKAILSVPTDATSLSDRALVKGTPSQPDSTSVAHTGTNYPDFTDAVSLTYGYNYNCDKIYLDGTDKASGDTDVAEIRYVPHFSQRTGLVGIGDNLTNYQLFYDGKLNPSRKVDCEGVASGRTLSQQWAIESEKALAMAGIRPLSFRHLHENWFIGRALSLQDGVYDTRGKDFNLQLAYEGESNADPRLTKAPTRNKLWCNYVAHLRRMVVKGNNISLEV